MTTFGPTVLCPIDFSPASRIALHYAAAVADHFGARLTLLFVEHPLLEETVANTSWMPSLSDQTKRELERFCRETPGLNAGGAKTLEYRVAFGKPASEIVREAHDVNADLIVMSSRGNSGFKKMFFGSTTEHVLRDTSVPVLVTSDDQTPVASLSEIARHVEGVMAPVDLSAATSHQVKIAAGIAEALSVPLTLLHVLEPIFIPISARLAVPGADAVQRADADERLSEVANSVSERVKTESLLLTGEPSAEIVKAAEACHTNLIVMGLHSSPFPGPRMGSVTYRVLCHTRALVLALPPQPAESRAATTAVESRRVVA